MAPRTVLSLIESLGLGGAERLLATVLPRLDPVGFRPLVAHLRGPSELAEPLRASGISVSEVGFGGPGDLPKAVRRTRELIVQERVDVVHTHLYFANVVGRLASLGLAPVVSTLHNPDYTYEARRTVRFAGRKLLDRATLRLARPRLLAVSHEVRRDYEKHFGARGIEVMYNCVAVDEIGEQVRAVDREAARRELGLGPAEVVFLHAGRFHPQKAHDVLLQALGLARREAPSLRLLLAGEGDGQAAMRGLAGDLGLGDAVLFLGSVLHMPRLHAVADAFVFPSRYEAFGIALLEAMAAGLPAVVTRAGGIPEVATPESALMVEVDDVPGLAAAMVRLAGDAALRARMGEAGLKAAQRFDASEWVPRLERVYEAL